MMSSEDNVTSFTYEGADVVYILNKSQRQCRLRVFSPWDRKSFFPPSHLKLSIVKNVVMTFLGRRLSGVFVLILKMSQPTVFLMDRSNGQTP